MNSQFFSFIFVSILSVTTSANSLSGCWSGPGEKYGSLGSYLDHCPATYSGTFDKWETQFSVDQLSFQCRHDSWLVFKNLFFTANKGTALLRGEKVGTISENKLNFDFKEVSQVTRVNIQRTGNALKISAEVRSGSNLIYSFHGKLQPCTEL